MANLYKCGKKKKNVYIGEYQPCSQALPSSASWVGRPGNDQGASLVPRLPGNEAWLVHINTEDQV